MIKIHIIPCLSDNYAYIVENKALGEAVLIDIPEAKPIAAKLAKIDAKLTAVLITHHHFDHIDGLETLDTDRAIIIGAQADAHRLPKLDMALEANQSLEIAGMKIEILDAPGHTIGHIAYYLTEADALFSADSLMLWGCGRLFEGTPEDMYATLSQFAKLPDNTQIYSGHNYGEVNGKFALSLSDEAPLKERLDHIRAQNNAGEAVVPVTLGEEKATNPFLRVDDDAYAELLGIGDKPPLERFAHIRKLRDQF